MKAALVLCPLSLAVAAPAFAQQRTLIMTLTEDVRSLDATTSTLGLIDKYDIAAVTPSTTGATMFNLLPTAAISVLVGDPDADGVVAEFHKDKTGRNWAHAGCFLRNADRDRGDPRLLFWTVQDDGSPSSPAFLVFVNGGNRTHKVRPGDFVRIGENGSAEFFLTQEQIMKAAGQQTGNVAPGASDICQDAGGAIYYSPPLNGHYVSDGQKQVLALEGSIVWIPRAAITYDARGNVQDVTAGSSRLVVEMGTNTPSPNPTIVAMVSNSTALDRDGNRMATTGTNWPTNLSGLAIDPNGGTFTSSLTGSQQHPHLVFAFDNGSYRGTVFSTSPFAQALGSVATINGVEMGNRLAKADASWLGCVGQGDAPTIHGLEIADWRLKPKAPWGVSVMDTAGRGGVDMALDPFLILDFQGPTLLGAVLLTLGIGPARGRFLISAGLPQFDGFASVYTLNIGPFLGAHGPTDTLGRYSLKVPTPQDVNLKGVGLIWQCLYVNRAPSRHSLSNPIVTELR